MSQRLPDETDDATGVLPVSVDDRIVWDTWLSLFRFPVVSVADEVGTFAALSSRAKSTTALADELQLDARALAVHLGALAALGFMERREGLWRAAAAARRWLHPRAEGYVGPVLHRFVGQQPFHAQLLETLRTGDRAQQYPSVAEEWERGAMPPELARSVTAFMNAHSRAAACAVAQQQVFGQVASLLDVGGGSGIFAIEMAQAWPSLSATVLEIDTICAEADRYIAQRGAGARVQTLPVDMFTQPWPRGFDTHFFSNIFHDWSDETCRMLARKSFEALPSGGRILLHEVLMDDEGTGPWHAAAFSLLMLIGTKGRQFTLAELRGFLEAAGFVDVEAGSTGGGYYSLVSARRP
ncbi:MAG: ubiquinone/menaquinone biosynthesis protein [Pseudomonadota bacterium]|nr:ubiquinone/menaquinone biosynthesis protein [Pseudomonadota bacterium]